MIRTTTHLAAGALFCAALAACDNPAGGPGDDGRVQLRFGTTGAASASLASFQTGGSDALVLTGSNGTLTITDIHLVVAEFEVDGDDDATPCTGDDCEDFQVGPVFVDLPLGGGSTAVGTGDIPPGTYRELEFEVEDLDDDEEDPAERARIEALRQQILAQFPDWPRDASMRVVGTFTPAGGAPRDFAVFLEAEIEIEIGLSPPLVVGPGESRALQVELDPAALFVRGGQVLDLSGADADDELEFELETGFRGRGSDDD